MARSYEAQQIIPLPQFDAGSCSSVVAAMLQLADKHKRLPAAVQEARDLLAEALVAMDAALGKTLVRAPAVEADPERDEATAWTALEEQLSSTMKLKLKPGKAAIAAELHQTLFSEGLTFLRGAPAKRWSETGKRLAVLVEPKVAAKLASIGAEDFVASIEDTHAEVGKALGFTVAKPPPEPTQVKLRFNELKAALRRYTLQLSASERPSDPASGPLAALLQSPLSNYQAPVKARPAPPAGAKKNPAADEKKAAAEGTKAAADEKKTAPGAEAKPAEGAAASAAAGTETKPPPAAEEASAPTPPAGAAKAAAPST